MQNLLLFLLIGLPFSIFGQTFEGHSLDDTKAYHCLFRINTDSSVNFIYNTKGNGVYADYKGTIKQINDTLFSVSADLLIGQYAMKGGYPDTLYVHLDSNVSRTLDKIEIEYADRKTRRQFQGYSANGKPLSSIKMPINQTLFNDKKGSNYVRITVNRKNPITRKWVSFKIYYGSSAEITTGHKLQFDVVIKDNILKTIGTPPLQTNNFLLKEID